MRRFASKSIRLFILITSKVSTTVHNTNPKADCNTAISIKWSEAGRSFRTASSLWPLQSEKGLETRRLQRVVCTLSNGSCIDRGSLSSGPILSSSSSFEFRRCRDRVFLGVLLDVRQELRPISGLNRSKIGLQSGTPLTDLPKPLETIDTDLEFSTPDGVRLESSRIPQT